MTRNDLQSPCKVAEIVNAALSFVKSYPCAICGLENSKDHSCAAGVRYRGTCPVFRKLKIELLKTREVEGNE